jgi:predicted transcriptional regulator
MKMTEKWMLDFLFDHLFKEDIDPEEQEAFGDWVEEVANKITEIINDSDNSEEFAVEVLDKIDEIFINLDKTLMEVWRNGKDIESAAYKVLDKIKKKI